MEIDNLIHLVKLAVAEFYKRDQSLIEKDLCERCMVHRLAVYLEEIFNGYNVDCEFNKSFYGDVVNNKVLSSINGNYVDIIVNKRSNNLGENLLCFEVKKEKNKRDRDKDGENLKILTDPNRFGYVLGFNIILGITFETTKIGIYSQGREYIG